MIRAVRPRPIMPDLRLRRGSKSRVRELQPGVNKAWRLLRAASRLGVPGALPGPPELLPMGARSLAQGYLNRFSMPVLNNWLLPAWMRSQSDPDSGAYVPRSVINLMVNQTHRNWTGLGIPGAGHPVECIVDRAGLLTPVPGGPSLDWWVEIEGRGPGLLSPCGQQVSQRLQDGLPVVVSAFEANGLRVSSECWMLPLAGTDWAAMQVVLFNIADMPLSGRFFFALRPYNAEGISPIYNISCDGQTLRADGRAGPITWPAPEGWALSGLRAGDLFRGLAGRDATGSPASLFDPHGFAHGVLQYCFAIEPWEEAEFLAFMPVHRQGRALPGARALFSMPRHAMENMEAQLQSPDPQLYSRAKAATTLGWRSLLDGGGMGLRLPHLDLQASWEASRAHVLALHDGDVITPGPDLYHSFWFRDAAYMIYALSACGYAEAAAQLLRGIARRQRRSGAFVSQRGEWDSTGQVLWCITRHLQMHPDPWLLRELRPAVAKGAHWIRTMLARSPDGLMPPGISSEHLGPPDRYYWDNLWSLAGLIAAEQLLGRSGHTRRAIAKLRHHLNIAWKADMEALGREVLPAAPGRGLDLGMAGTLVGWFPLQLLPASGSLLVGTLEALEETTFYKGALFVGSGHSGWGTYLNMRIAGCRLMQGSQRGWQLMAWLLHHATPTYSWPEAIHPHTGGGSAGDGHHGWASAEWLLLVRALLFVEEEKALVITPALPEQWLSDAGQICVEKAPTRFGPLGYNLEWDSGGRSLRLDLRAEWRVSPEEVRWSLPGPISEARLDDREASWSGNCVHIPPSGGVASVVMEK